MTEGQESSQNSASTGSRRPIKLRSACNQCRSAKVKCSGEKSGCERCRNLSTHCVYAESRVGRVPGIRAKRKSLATQEPRHLPPSRSANDQLTDTIIAMPGHDQPQQAEERVEEVVPWIADWQLDPVMSLYMAEDDLNVHADNQAACEETSTSSESFTPVAGGVQEYVSPHTSSDLSDFLLSPNVSSTGHSQSSTLAPPATSSVDMSRKKEIDSQCCQECCQIISDLENYVQADLKAFNIVIPVVRKVFEKVGHLSSLQREYRSPKCLLLFGTVMYQAMDLLEGCLAAIESEKERRRGQRLMAPAVSFGLGGLSGDAEEQLAFNAQRILKECHQGTELVGQLQRLVRQGPEVEVSGSSDVNGDIGRGDCYRDLESRFKALKKQIESKDA